MTLKTKLKQIGITTISLITLFGCGNSNQSLPVQYQSYLPVSTFAASNTADSIDVYFNNAYKGLYEENEKIGRQDPNNPDKYFFKLIKSAQKTLDISFYDIDDPDAVKAFIGAHQRGVKVRIVTDSDNFRDKHDETKPRKAIEDLKAAGIKIRGDERSGLMHHKFMIVDQAIVWVSSMNPTTTSMYHHNNNSVKINSPALAQNYQQEFNRNFVEGKFGPKPYPVPNPVVKLSDGTVIKNYYSPRGGAQDAILQELQKARKNIKFMAFSFTEKSTGELLVQKRKQGLQVEGIFDSCLLSKYSKYWDFRKNKINSWRDGNQALLHHKVIIIDDHTVITGSYNFSNSAEASNNENIIIIDSARIASQFNQEYQRVKYAAQHNTNLPPYDHPACGGH